MQANAKEGGRSYPPEWDAGNVLVWATTNSGEGADHCLSLHNPLLKMEETYYSETWYLSTRVHSVTTCKATL